MPRAAVRPLLFSTMAYEALATRMLRKGAFQRGKLEHQRFPDGERYLRVGSQMRHRDAVLVAGTISDADTLEAYDIASGLVESGARSLTLVLPYFGYSTMERAQHAGEVVTAKTRARLLSSLPLAPAGNRVVLLDLHSEGVAFYFEGNLRPVHLSAQPIIVDALKRLDLSDAVVACTDAGRAKWVEALANALGVPAAFVFKRRVDARTTEVTAVSAQVKGRHVIIYDDMIRTGGSLVGAARAYARAGARRMTAVTTHGLFPEDALPRLTETGLFDRILCTDSHPRAEALRGKALSVVSVAPLLSGFVTGSDEPRPF